MSIIHINLIYVYIYRHKHAYTHIAVAGPGSLPGTRMVWPLASRVGSLLPRCEDTSEKKQKTHVSNTNVFMSL